MTSEAWLSLGANLGDPPAQLAEAVRRIDAHPSIAVTSKSKVLSTKPWGKTDQPDFLNAAAEIVTGLNARGLLELCLDSERRLNRVRGERWGPRPIDLDILTFGDARVHEPGLDLPHPRLAERAFVLVPLSELAPDLVIDGRRVADMLAGVDASGIERLPGGRGWWQGPS